MVPFNGRRPLSLLLGRTINPERLSQRLALPLRFQDCLGVQHRRPDTFAATYFDDLVLLGREQPSAFGEIARVFPYVQHAIGAGSDCPVRDEGAHATGRQLVLSRLTNPNSRDGDAFRPQNPSCDPSALAAACGRTESGIMLFEQSRVLS